MPDLRIIGAAVALLTAFLVGWWINGTRWEAKYMSLVTTHNQERVAIIEKSRHVEQEARQKEQALQASVDAERKRKDDKIRSLNSQLASALDSLRQRPPRTSSPVQLSCPTGDQQVASGATGAQLYREDAEFLIREAARADQVVAELEACYSAYEAAKKASKTK